MSEQILSAVHGVTTMLFGIYCSAFFLGIKPIRKNILTMFLLFLGQGLLYVIDLALFGETLANMSYPLIVHFPLVLFLSVHYKYPLISSAVSVFSAYLCCQISNWTGLFALAITGLQWCYYSVRILTTTLTFVLLYRYVFRSTKTIFTKNARELSIIGFLPFVYYVFDYASTKFSTLLYSGNKAVVEFMGFAFCIAYLVFLIIYFQEYENKQEITQYSNLREMQLQSMQNEIEQVKISSQRLAILRHDMRHFLTNISGYIENGETEKAQEFIREVISATDNTATQCYSKNEVVNLILSSYEEKIKACGIEFKYSVEIPEELPYSEVDLTAILSNALENAIHAVKKLPPEKRYIELDLRMKENKLLISIKNTFAEAPELRDGLPVAKEEGHGFGSQSIRYVAEKLHGNCQFSVVDDRFVLRVVL